MRTFNFFLLSFLCVCSCARCTQDICIAFAIFSSFISWYFYGDYYYWVQVVLWWCSLIFCSAKTRSLSRQFMSCFTNAKYSFCCCCFCWNGTLNKYAYTSMARKSMCIIMEWRTNGKLATTELSGTKQTIESRSSRINLANLGVWIKPNLACKHTNNLKSKEKKQLTNTITSHCCPINSKCQVLPSWNASHFWWMEWSADANNNEKNK